jgi:hypothetical protein
MSNKSGRSSLNLKTKKAIEGNEIIEVKNIIIRRKLPFTIHSINREMKIVVTDNENQTF